ncbi:MAG: hypothetical protein H6562_16190 [Lewinellaceae bacterium]|nr:hypothetical protein [Lewinella sp.]MCB9280434.1 hypothetical protein [Lewinellaceae bacterium]
MMARPILNTAKTDLFPGLHPAVAEAGRFRPADARSVREMLTRLSRPWLAAQSAGRPVDNSLLTPNGYPLEFNFSSRSDDICYTAEPGLPDDSPARKRQYIRRFAPDFDPETYPLLKALSVAPDQRYGHWISFRHQYGMVGCKVYQEVPVSGRPLVRSALGAEFPEFTGPALEPMLIGVMPGKPGLMEFYYRASAPSPAGLHRLFKAGNASGQLSFALNCLGYLASQPAASVLNRLRLGVSLRAAPGKTPEITLFVHAAQLFPDNRQAAGIILDLAGQLGGQMPLYERLSRQFEEGPAYPAHGMISLKFDPPGKVEVGVGVVGNVKVGM